MTENTHRPPGRRTRATSLITASMSVDEGKSPVCGAGNIEARIGERQGGNVSADRGHGDADFVIQTPAVLELAMRQVNADDLGALSHAAIELRSRHRTRPRVRAPRTSPNRPASASSRSFWSPDPAELTPGNSPVLGLVVVRLGVPPDPTGAPSFVRRDGPPDRSARTRRLGPQLTLSRLSP